MKPDVKPREPLKRGIRCISPLRCSPSQAASKLFHVRAHQVCQQRLLVGKVVVQRSRLDPNLARNLAHRYCRKSARRKQFERRLTHPLGGFNANTACRTSQAITK
jgi:hypothetical protein